MVFATTIPSAEEFVDWLSEVSPNIWEGECSGNPAVYDGFLEFLSKQDYEKVIRKNRACDVFFS
ncbi:MAG: hypothetical protein IJS52_06065 [Bacilli bacterium]|nr:hypothetical protein [Bacilli bacterium]